MTERTKKSTIQIELTQEQREQVKRVTGKEVRALELAAEELEERTTPANVVEALPHH
jgi:hypothetical protein